MVGLYVSGAINHTNSVAVCSDSLIFVHTATCMLTFHQFVPNFGRVLEDTSGNLSLISSLSKNYILLIQRMSNVIVRQANLVMLVVVVYLKENWEGLV